jgi:hypothetical protein
LCSGIAYNGCKVSTRLVLGTDEGDFDYAKLRNRLVITLAVLEISFLLLFFVCVVKIWWFLKKHPNIRDDKKSIAFKVFVGILCLSIRVIAI